MVAEYRSVLSIPWCARLLTSALLGRLPQGMSSLAIVLLVRGATGSYAAAGLAVGGYALANAAATPLQGRLVDRHNRLGVLLPAAAGQAVLVTALVVAAGSAAPAVVLAVLAGAAGGLQPALGPSMRALLGEIAPDPEIRETAYGLESVSQELIWIAGPLLVAVVVALASPSAALLVSAAVCVIGTTVFVTSPLARRARDVDARQGGALSIPGLRVLLAPMALMGMSIGAVEVGIPSLALHAGSRPSSGVMLALWSVGSLSGGLWYGAHSWRRPLADRFRWLMIVAAVCTGPFVAARTIPEGLICSVLAGVAIAPSFSCLYALVGRAVTAGSETEAFTWAASALIVGLSVGSALAGLAIGAAGVSGPFVLGCAASVCAAALALRARDGREAYA